MTKYIVKLKNNKSIQILADEYYITNSGEWFIFTKNEKETVRIAVADVSVLEIKELR